MKRILSLFGILVLLGAGCTASNDASEATATAEPSTWFLTTVTEAPIYAFEPYWQADVDFPNVPERSTERQRNRVWMQTVPEPIQLEDYPYKENLDYYEGEDWILLDVAAFPEQAKIPPEAEVRTIGQYEVGVVVNENGVFTLYFIDTETRLYQITPHGGEEVGMEDMEVLIGQLAEQE